MAEPGGTINELPELSASIASGTGLSPSALSLRNVETLLLTAQQQQLRHLRRLQQMRRQAEINAAMQVAWQEKQEAEERRRQAREAAAKEAQTRHVQHHGEVKARNAAAQQAATRTQELWRSGLADKLESAKQRTDDILRQRSLLSEFARVQSARIEARRRRTYANHERALEARREALEEKAAQEARHLAQRQELRLIQEEIRREEEALASVRREEIRRRAEAEAEAKGSYYEMKAEQRDRQLSERKQELEAQRVARAEEARARAAYAQQRAAQAGEAEAAKRERLAAQLEGKMAKVDSIMAQREALVREVQRVQAGMAAQEERMKAALDSMERTGKWHLPAELLESTAALQTALMGPAPPRSGCVSRGASGRSSPRGARPDSASGAVADTRVFRAGSARPGSAPAGGLRTSRQEAELQRVLEEEILREMTREQALAQEADHEERKRMMRQFAAEREAAKARILTVGSHLAA